MKELQEKLFSGWQRSVPEQRDLGFSMRAVSSSGSCLSELASRGFYLLLRHICFAEPSAREYNWATLFLGDINTGTWPSRLGESQMGELSMVTGSARLGPLSDYTANCRPVLSSERAPHRNKNANFRQHHSDRK
jgi:hypothetical protein